MPSVEADLARVDPAIMARLRARGFDPADLAAWSARLAAGRDRVNRVTSDVTPPRPGDVEDAPLAGSAEARRFEEAGLAAIRQGGLALAVLAGGMATRMGGVVKALVEVAAGRTFLDVRLAEHDRWKRDAPPGVPLWLMTSEATEAPIRRALGSRLGADDVATFEQHASLRLAPDGSLFFDAGGRPSAYATGHGDLPDALRSSGLLDRFLARGGRWVWIANLDNLGATVDPAILGWHMAHGGRVTFEVCDKIGTDRGGIPVRCGGRRVILEEFRLPEGFDAASVRQFNTNTLLADARALRDLGMRFTYVAADKKVDGRPAVQFERLIGEITAELEPRFVRVLRDGAASRFLPVKDPAELGARRDEIVAVARARGMWPG